MERNEVKEEYKWKVSDIFQNDDEWETAFVALEKSLDFEKFRGTLNTKENVYAYFKAEEAFSAQLLHIYLYAFMRHNEDLRDRKSVV